MRWCSRSPLLLHKITFFAVLVDIETFAFLVFVEAVGHHCYNFRKNQRHSDGPN